MKTVPFVLFYCAALLLLAAPAPVKAQFTFTTNNGAITITGYTGPGGAVTIPDTTNGWPVTGIGAEAFEGSPVTSLTIGTNVSSIGNFAFAESSLTNVIIPNSVVTIGDYAFQFCSSLAKISIGTNVTSIGLLAFADCTSLTSVTIPASVTNLGYIAFAWCPSLPAIMVATNNSAYRSVAGVLFNRNQTTLIEYPQGKAGGSYTIPASVTNLDDYAFNNCSSLTNLTLGTNVANIGNYAFSACGSLSSLTIPSRVTSIGDWAFQFCGGLTNVTLGTNVSSIGQGAFEACGSLTRVTIPDSVTSIGNWAFAGCTSLSAIMVATNNPSYSSVAGVLFNQNQTTLIAYPQGKAGGSYTIPASVTNIGEAAFESCSLTSITVPASVVSIGDYAFASGGILIGLAIPETVVFFQGNAPSADATVFSGQDNLTVYYLPGTTGWSATFAGVPATPWNPAAGLLQVAILPVEASYAGAQWQVDDGTWQSSGEIATNLSLGEHTVNFSTVTGWTTPARQTVLVSSNEITTVAGTYAKIPFEYATNNGTITILGYTGPGGAVTIPDTINGLPVTCIESFWVGLPGQPITIILPRPPILLPIASIPANGVPIPRVTTTSLPITSVTIPSSVTNIYPGVFGDCPKLAAIKVAAGNPAYDSVAGILFNYDQTALIEYPAVKIGSSYVVPSGVTNIGDHAFSGCANLTSITIGDRVSRIGFDVFARCDSLTAIMVSENNPAYGSVAGVLFNKRQTTLVQYPEGKAGTSYLIPGSVISIGTMAFANCDRLITVTMPGSVTDIGEGAFEFCTNLASATIGSHVVSIGEDAFQGCSHLNQVLIPASASNIGSTAFLNCSSLTAITVAEFNPSYLSLGGVWFGKSQTTLLQYPEAKTDTAYAIPNGVLSLGNFAFANCTHLTSVTIPNSVTNIGEAAFFNCTNLASVTIGYGVIYIGDSAFALCPNLAGAYFQGNAPGVDTNLFLVDVFSGDNQATAYYLTNTAGWGTNFAGIPTALWTLHGLSDASFDVGAKRFGFKLAGFSSQVIVVEACTNLCQPQWQPIQTNTLTGGPLYFTDPQWTNYPARFYRVRSP